jgi:aspartate-semialdehyde dehydrogenase
MVAPGLTFLEGHQYATALDVAGSDDVIVGRLRPDAAHPGAWLCWVACDNLRKGAATNAVQIVETVSAAAGKVAV